MVQNLLTVDELADKLRMAKSWVYGQSRLTGPDSIPMIRVGKYLRFDPVEVLAWLKEKQENEKHY